jgi:ABC-type multidrug transport system permease subunit
LIKSNRKLFFSLCFFILKTSVFSFLIFFNCFYWLMLLYDVIIVVVVASILRWAFIFVATTYKIKMMMIFAILRSMLFNLMFISFSVSDICFFMINVDNKTFKRWRRNNDVETSISSINLLRSKLLISLMRCSLRFFKKNFFKIVRIFVKTSRHLMNDDITSIRAENFYVFKR